MIIKFDSTGLTELGVIENFQGVNGLSVTVDLLLDDQQHPNYPIEGRIIGYSVYVDDVGDVRIVTGDYIVFIKPKTSVITMSEFENDLEKKRIVQHEIAVGLLEDIIQLLVDLSVTDTIKIELLRHVAPVIDMVNGNKLTAANVIANALPLTSNFTNGRKNAFLATIAASLAKL